MKVHPYLNFDGDAEKAFNFYKSVFGGEFLANMKMSEVPEGDKLSKEEQNRTMHIALPITMDTTLMASDIMPSAGHKLRPSGQAYIMLCPENRKDADRIFNQLSEGGDIEMPLQDQFWGDYFGSFTDKFGVQWMVDYNEQNT